MQINVYVYASERQQDEVSIEHSVAYQCDIYWIDEFDEDRRMTLQLGSSNPNLTALGESLSRDYLLLVEKWPEAEIFLQNKPSEEGLKWAERINNIQVRSLSEDEFARFIQVGALAQIVPDRWVIDGVRLS